MGENGFGPFGIILLILWNWQISLAIFVALIAAAFIWWPGRRSKSAEARSRRSVIGFSMLGAVLVAYLLPPEIHAVYYRMLERDYMALSDVPETLEMRQSNAIVVLLGPNGCEYVCPELLRAGGLAKVGIMNGAYKRPEELGATLDLTAQGVHVLEDQGSGSFVERWEDETFFDKVDYVFVLAHDFDNSPFRTDALPIPRDANPPVENGFFIFEVADPQGFNLTEAKHIATLYSGVYDRPKRLWRGGGFLGNAMPHQAYFADVLVDLLP